MLHGFVCHWHLHVVQWELFFCPATSLRPCRRSHIQIQLATWTEQRTNEKQAWICINTHVASIYRQRMFLGQIKWCRLCLHHARFVYIYAFYVEFACLPCVLHRRRLVWSGWDDLHYVMRRLAQPIQRSTRALNSHQTREHESSTDCLTKWWHLGSNPSRSEGIWAQKAVAKCGV